jgi:hypothetical protein
MFAEMPAAAAAEGGAAAAVSETEIGAFVWTGT